MPFIILMDRPGREGARQFYRELNRAVKGGYKIERIQQSCYLAQEESGRVFLTRLGEKYGFKVRAFEVAMEVE